MIQNISVLGMLGLCAIEDYRKKEILLYPVLMFGIVGLLMHLMYRNQSVYNMLAGIFVGVFLLVMNRVSRGKIGLGDGLVLVVTGIYLGFEDNTRLFFYGLFLCGGWSLIMMLLKRKQGKDEVAFIPFLLIAYLGMIIL